MSGFLFLLGGRKRAFLGILLIGLLVNTGMALLTPLFLKALFDRCIAAKDMRLFVGMLAGFVVLATGWRLLNYFQNLQIQRLKQDIFRDLAGKMLGKYYRLPYAEAVRSDAGYHVSRIFDEPIAATGTAVDLALALAGAAASLSAALALLIALSPQATLLLMASIPFLMHLANRYGSAVKRHAEQEKEEEGRLRGYLTKAAQAYRNVRLFALEETVSGGLAARLAVLTTLSFARCRSSCLHNTIGGILMSHAEVLVIVVCGFEMMHGRMTFGAFMAFMSGFWTAVGSLRALTQKVPELAKNDSLLERIRAFQAAPEAVRGRAPGAGGSVGLRDVSFGYGGQSVVSDLTLDVGRGQSLLLCGRNGSGKTTIAHLLAAFLAPTQGEARTLPLERVSACLTPQHLIPGTVGDNLGYAKLSSSQKSYLETLLEGLGLEHSLGADPETLSAGQRKKVEVVLGLMKDADLYIFDEPLANVDTQSKPRVLELIFERARDKALVVIMHGDDELRARFDSVVELGAPQPA